MKKIQRILLWLLVPALLLTGTSCLDITEEYHIRPDGSGTATMKIDVSQMMSLLQGLGGESEAPQSEELDKMFEDNESVDRLSQIPGIHNVKNIGDKEAGIVGFTYEFDNLTALSQSMESGQDLSSLTGSLGMSMDDGAARENSFSMKGRKFTRVHPSDVADKKTAEEEDPSAAMAMAMLGEGEYKIIYHFDQTVKKTTIANAKVSADKHTVTVKSNLGDLAKGEAKMGGTIKLK